MIRIKNLCKSYGSLQVLKGLTLDVEDGVILVILGRSGVGKSVLFKQILGIEQPDAGEIEIDGESVTSSKHHISQKLVMSMSMLFQGGALFDSMTVGDNVAFFLSQHGDPKTGKRVEPDEIRKRVKESLEMVDLAGTEKKMPSELSGGMRKRAALARAIISEPKYIFYDEPTTGLDPITAMQINRLIIKTQKKLKGTSVVVTHDIRSALELADILALHDEGIIKHKARKQDFMHIDDPQIQAFFTEAMVTPEIIKKNRGEE